MPKRLSNEEVMSFLYSQGYILESKYINQDEPIRIKCPNGHRYEVTFRNFRRGSRCKKCVRSFSNSSRKRKSKSDVYEYFKQFNYEIENGLDDYKNNLSSLTVRCPSGHTYKTTYGSFHQGYRCKLCSNSNLKHSYEFIYNEFKKRGYLLLENEYISGITKMDYACLEHPYDIQSISYNALQRGRGCRECWIERCRERRGERSPNWNSEITIEERTLRRSFHGYVQWRVSVFERDDYTCQCCSERGVELIAHHKDGYHWCKERRIDVDNGVTLCVDCHNEFHNTYGYRFNTCEQYDEFITSSINKQTNSHKGEEEMLKWAYLTAMMNIK